MTSILRRGPSLLPFRPSVLLTVRSTQNCPYCENKTLHEHLTQDDPRWIKAGATDRASK